MHTYLKIAAAGSVVALALTATVAFAHTRPSNSPSETQTSQVFGQQTFNKPDTEKQNVQQKRSSFDINETRSTTTQNKRPAYIQERLQEGTRQFSKNLATTTRNEHSELFKEEARQFRNNKFGSSTSEVAQPLARTFEGQNKERAERMREKVQNHIKDIENKTKQRLVSRLTKRFAYINKAWITHFSKQLDRYAAILQKIQDRVDSGTGAGKNVTAVETSINLAQTAIQNAHIAISVQQDKAYTLDLTSNTNTSIATSTPKGQAQIMQGFITAFQSMRNQIFSDLSVLRSVAMAKVRTSVIAALKSLVESEQGSVTTASSSQSTATSN